MSLRFENNEGEQITSFEEWRDLAPPAGAHHWVDGRSAAELARDWIEGDAASRVSSLLDTRPELAGAVLREAVAEKKTHFDAIGSGPRNHDLLVRGANDSGRITIGVEGKADESFDLPLREWREARTGKSSRSRAPERLDRLTSAFFGTTLDATPALGSLGYQLLSALGGTLADARSDGATRAVLLVHEFVTDKTADARHALNAATLEEFVSRLGPAKRTGEPDAWLAGPWQIEGDGRWLPDHASVYVGKIVTTQRQASRIKPLDPEHPLASRDGETTVRLLGPEAARRFRR